mgnify:CR=1 FL=1
MTENVLEIIKKLRESKKRNFPQTFDLLINLKEFDLKKQESKITEEFSLPNGRGEDAKVVVFSDALRDVKTEVLNSSDIENLGKNVSEAKKLGRNTDFFLSEPKLMPLIGKVLGRYLAPRGKMPKIIAGDVNSSVDSLKKSTRIRVKDSPVIQCVVGNENMKDEEISGNIEALLKYMKTRLPKGKTNIGKVMLKLTMSEPVKLEV